MQARNRKKYFSNFARRLIFATNIVAMVLLFCSFLSWRVSPLKTNLFSYVGLGFGFILLLNVMYLALWVTFKKWKLAAVSLLALIFCYKPITVFFPLHVFPKKAPSTALKILTYNVQGFINESSKKAKKNPILDYIAETDADIVCLQEYLVSKTGESLKTQRDVNRILNKYPYYSVTPLEFSGKYHVYGLACFSKYPIEKTKEVVFNSSYNGAAIYTINVEGKKIVVANVHLESNSITSEDKELYSNFIQNKPETNLEEVTSNIRSRLGKAYRIRVEQVRKLKDNLDKSSSDATILCGDFNDTPISYTYAHMLKGLQDAFVGSGFGPGITYHEDFFWFRIDNIFHSSHFKAYEAKVDRVAYSDHYPLRTYLQVNN